MQKKNLQMENWAEDKLSRLQGNLEDLKQINKGYGQGS